MFKEQEYGSILHVIAVAFVIFLPSLTFLGLLQTIDLNRQWGQKPPIIIELTHSYSQDSLNLLKQFIQNSEFIESSSLKFISKQEAYDQMKDDPSLGLNDSLIENPFLDVLLCYPQQPDQYDKAIQYLNSARTLFFFIENIDAGNKLKSGMDQTFAKFKTMLILLTLLLLVLAYFIVTYLLKSYLSKKQNLLQAVNLMGGDAVKPYRPISFRLGIASSLLGIVLIGLFILVLFVLVPDLYNLLAMKNFLLVMLVLIILGPTLHLIRLKSIIHSIIQQ